MEGTDLASSEACDLLVAWLSDENATQYDLLRELTRCRLELQENSELLLKAMGIIAEATSANRGCEGIRSDIRSLLTRYEHEVFSATAGTSTSTGQAIAAS